MSAKHVRKEICFIEKCAELVPGNTFHAYLLKQFLSPGEDGHKTIITLEEVSFHFEGDGRLERKAVGETSFTTLGFSLAWHTETHLSYVDEVQTYSGSSEGCSEEELRLHPADMLSSWVAMALMLVSATT